MRGDDRVRFCDQCKLHVYNFSQMTEKQAERLLRETGGRLCGQIYRRRDGTILTRDCPVGLRAMRRRLAGLVGRIAAAVVLAGGLFGFFKSGAGSDPYWDPRWPAADSSISQLQPFATIQRWLDPNPPVRRLWLGVILYSPPPTSPPKSPPPAIDPSDLVRVR